MDSEIDEANVEIEITNAKDSESTLNSKFGIKLKAAIAD